MRSFLGSRLLFMPVTFGPHYSCMKLAHGEQAVMLAEKSHPGVNISIATVLLMHVD